MASFLNSIKSLNPQNWKWYGLSFISGGLSALSMAPTHIFLVLFITFPVLAYQVLQTTSKKQAFMTGFTFGSGYFIFSLYWITAALMTDIETWWWAMPLSAIALPSIFAIYTGLATLITYISKTRGLQFYLFFSASLAISEWLRGNLFTGFPWNLFGYTWGNILPIYQSLSLGGIYTLSLLTIIWSISPAIYIDKAINKLPKIIYLSLSVLLFFGLLLWGYDRLQRSETRAEFLKDINLRILQPNFQSDEKWDPDLMWGNQIKNIKNLSAPSKNSLPITHHIWPETAINLSLDRYPQITSAIQSNLPENGWLITGYLKINENVLHNTLSLIHKDKGYHSDYPKSHLVPFGEYIPFRQLISIPAFVSTTDFSFGTGPYTISVSGIPDFSSLICYEIIFPHKVTNPDKRPKWILTVTNDMWYGNTSGPYQHFISARARAIEEGLSVIRSANTGVSAVMDPYGRILHKVGLNQEGYIDSQIPSPIDKTLYSYYGDLIFFTLLLILLTLSQLYIGHKVSVKLK